LFLITVGNTLAAAATAPTVAAPAKRLRRECFTVEDLSMVRLSVGSESGKALKLKAYYLGFICRDVTPAVKFARG